LTPVAFIGIIDGGGWGRRTLPPLEDRMSVYERLAEEKRDGKKTKARRKAQSKNRWSVEERARIQRRRTWRYYRDAARIRKRILKG